MTFFFANFEYKKALFFEIRPNFCRPSWYLHKLELIMNWGMNKYVFEMRNHKSIIEIILN